MDEKFVRHINEIDKLLDRLKANATPRYDSGWFAVVGGNSYTKNHLLGSIPRRYTVLAATSSAGGGNPQVAPSLFWLSSASAYGGYRIEALTSSDLSVQINTYTHYNGTAYSTSGYYRVIVDL